MKRPWAYSVELRERALAALDAKMPVKEVSRLFGVGVTALYDWRRIQRHRGSLAPLPHQSGNKARVDEEGAAVVRAIVAETPDATDREIAMYFVERTDRPCSRASMQRALARLNITRKKSR